MTISIQDRYIGITKLEDTFKYVDNDKQTKICSSDIAQFIDEYYSELFESIASDDKAFAQFNFLLDTSKYYSFAEIAEDYLADYETFANYDPYETLAHDYGYDTFEEFEQYAIIIYDNAIDGFIVMGY